MRLRRVVAALVAAGLLLVPAAPAAAHPFGPPPTARVAAQGTAITIDWSATPDDAVAIGELLGVMPQGSVALYREEAAAQVAPSARDEARLSASPQLAQYLAEHVVVVQDGQECPADIAPPADFVHHGARIVLRCPDAVSEVVLRITMLHDIHPAYRTVAIGTGSDPAQSVFTTESPRATWRFGAAATGGGQPLAAWAGVGLVVVVVATILVRRRRSGRP